MPLVLLLETKQKSGMIRQPDPVCAKEEEVSTTQGSLGTDGFPKASMAFLPCKAQIKWKLRIDDSTDTAKNSPQTPLKYENSQTSVGKFTSSFQLILVGSLPIQFNGN